MEMPYQKEDVMPYMSGMWREALQSVCGLSNDVFNKRHQSCPNCGGKDRFRWTDKLHSPGDGGAVCNGCGNDTGIGWLMKLTGENYSECINILGRFLGKVPQEYVVKANKKARRTPVVGVGVVMADHETCMKVMERTESRAVTPLSRFESLPTEAFNVGVKVKHDGSEAIFHSIPCQLVHDDGLDEEFCNVLFYDDEGSESFLTGKHTLASVAVTGKTEKAIYLCLNWIDAQHIAFSTGQEVWACFTPENLEIVAHRYKGERELRVACKTEDRETLYMADDRQLKVIVAKPGGYRSGMEAKLYDASTLI